MQNAQLSRSLRPFIALTVLLTAAEHLPIFTQTVDASVYHAYFPSFSQDLAWISSAVHDLPATSISTVSAATSTATAATSTSAAAAAVVSAEAVAEPLSLAINFTEVLGFLQRVTDFLSVLMLIRMTKLIGADRDVIIADKVLAACREFPVREASVYLLFW